MSSSFHLWSSFVFDFVSFVKSFRLDFIEEIIYRIFFNLWPLRITSSFEVSENLRYVKVGGIDGAEWHAILPVPHVHFSSAGTCHVYLCDVRVFDAVDVAVIILRYLVGFEPVPHDLPFIVAFLTAVVDWDSELGD